jgi:hypothetical protein
MIVEPSLHLSEEEDWWVQDIDGCGKSCVKRRVTLRHELTETRLMLDRIPGLGYDWETDGAGHQSFDEDVVFACADESVAL